MVSGKTGDHWRDRRVLVTGASGLLGSWLVQELLGRGADVICLIRDWVPESKLIAEGWHEKVNIVRGELEDYTTALRALNEYEVQTVFHLGAQTIVGTANRSALSTFESNIRGTWSLLEACRACQPLVSSVVVTSSDKAYGASPDLPYTEDTPLCGRTPYEVSKSCTDLIASCYFHTYRLPVAITRCGNLFGGGDLNFSRLIPDCIRACLQGKPFVIRSDGKFIRDYLYVEDVVEGFLLLGERLHDPGLHGEAFNLSPERPMSVIEVVDRIRSLTGRDDLEPIIKNEAAGEIREQYLDCSKATSRLGWKPGHTLDEGLTPTIDWYRRYLERGNRS